jgi:hypothetical protein|tara:strand:- start:939 stop:1406 length:468 start_codon:yes stop_codon:yes gene_type:complete
MDTNIMNASGVGVEIAELATPFVIALIALVVTMMFKDFATSLAKGLRFKWNRAFNEGDKVILDGCDSVIVKIGITETVFGVYGDRGYTWRYVPNERIQFLKLEKVINKDLHLDTDAERAAKLQALIDINQTNGIINNADAVAKNAEEIKKIRNGK